MEYTKLAFRIKSQEQSELLMALLSELPFESFEEVDNALHAFIKSKEFEHSKLLEIINEYEGINNIEFTETKIPATNWNEVWERNFSPIYINDLWSIRANFHESLNTKNEIIINPKMSFGTGHHATTKMMIEFMSDMNFMTKTVFDFGAGTGILSIMAFKLGALKVVALDHEEWAYRNAEENFETNSCTKIENHLGTIESLPTQKYDMILANINKNVLIESAIQLEKSSYSDTILLLSGILDSDQSDIISIFSALNFSVEEVKTNLQWCAIKFIKL